MCIEEPDLKKGLKTIRNYSQASLCDKNYSFFSCQTYCTYKIVICKSWWQGKWKKEKFAQNTLQEHAAKFLVQQESHQNNNNMRDKTEPRKFRLNLQSTYLYIYTIIGWLFLKADRNYVSNFLWADEVVFKNSSCRIYWWDYLFRKL